MSTNKPAAIAVSERSEPNCCGVEKTLQIIGSKWTTLLLHNIFEGRKRFSELQKAMPGISSKTLAVRLQELTKDGLIRKKVFAEVPLHVEYSLTDKGESLGVILKKMSEWGQKH